MDYIMTKFGISSIIIGLVVMTFSSPLTVDKDVYEYSVLSTLEFFNIFLKNASLKGNGIYIPPYANLPKGGTFIPLLENFELNLAQFDEKYIIIKRGRESGLVITPPTGYHLSIKFSEYIDIKKSSDIPSLISSISGVMNIMELVGNIECIEEDDIITLNLENVHFDGCRKCNINVCKKMGCPICSSILFSLSTYLNSPIIVENIEKKGSNVKIKCRNMGKIEKYLWGM
jgi:hypothetical protein